MRLAKDLRVGGAGVWVDQLDIAPGQRWDRAVEDALAKCLELVVILSPAAVESTNVMDEVSLALEDGKTVVPVLHRQCKIPFRLRRLQYVDLSLDYKAGLDRLLETLGDGAAGTAKVSARFETTRGSITTSYLGLLHKHNVPSRRNQQPWRRKSLKMLWTCAARGVTH